MDQQIRLQIDRMCHPRGIAIFGGTRLGAFANLITTSHILYGYKGNIYPISNNGDQIGDVKVIRSLDEVDGPVDLAIIAVPALAVPGVMRDCLAHGVAGVTIQTSGFAEVGAEGRAIQDEIEAIARQGLLTIGPNCFGIHCPRGGLTLLPGGEYPREPGNVGLICQSGGMANDFVHEGEAAGLRMSKVFSYGNGADLDAVSLMAYLADDDDTHVIGAYLEGVPDGRRFLEVVRYAVSRKPVVIWKGGLTPLGARMTMSHTGSLGGETEIWKGAMKQAGVIDVEDLDGLIDAVSILSFLKHPGRKISVMGGGGAIGVYSSDLIHRLGLELPVFSGETQQVLSDILENPGSSVVNPIDTAAPTIPLGIVSGLIRETLVREPIDVFVLISLLHPMDVMAKAQFRFNGLEPPSTMTYFEQLLAELLPLKAETGKEIVMVIENRAHATGQIETEQLYREIRSRFQKNGIPVFNNERKALGGVQYALMRPVDHRLEQLRGNDQFLQQMRRESKTGYAAG